MTASSSGNGEGADAGVNARDPVGRDDERGEATHQASSSAPSRNRRRGDTRVMVGASVRES
jgi:hypothetical protein